MEVVGMILLAVGAILSLVGGIWFLIVTFQESLVWGLCCLFIPFAAVVFLFMHWDKGRKPFLIQLAGLALVIAGVVLTGSVA